MFVVRLTRFLSVSVLFRTTDRSDGDFFNSLDRFWYADVSCLFREFADTQLPFAAIFGKRTTVELSWAEIQRSENGWENFSSLKLPPLLLWLGLFYISISLNLDQIIANLVFGLPGRALEALVILLTLLVISTLMLVPEQNLKVIGAEVLGVGLANWVVVVAIQLLQLKNLRRLEPKFRWRFLNRMILGQAATLPFVIVGNPQRVPRPASA
jgi:modulator of FtsH protease